MFDESYLVRGASYAIEVGKLNHTKLVLGLNDSSKHADLCAKLKPHSTITIGRRQYSFKAEITHEEVGMITNGAVQKIKMEVVIITINSPHLAIMLEPIFKILYLIGYPLDLTEQAHMLSCLSLGSDLDYLQRADEVIDRLTTKYDDPIALEFAQLFRLTMQIDMNKRPGFVYKLAHQLYAKSFVNCAQALISLMRNDESLQSLGTDLAAGEAYSLSESEQSTLQQAEIPLVETVISSFETKIDTSTLILGFSSDAKRRQIFSQLQDLNPIAVGGEQISLKLKFTESNTIPRQPAIQIEVPPAKARSSLDFIFMFLQKNNCCFQYKNQYFLRKHLQMVGYDDYTYFARSVINMMEINANSKDDPKSFHFSWLMQMSYELPERLRAGFVLRVARLLNQRKHNRCALSLAIFYHDDPLHPKLRDLVSELKAIVGNQYMLQLSYTGATPETILAKVKRLEHMIAKLCALDLYIDNKRTILRVYCELTGVHPDVAKDNPEVVVLIKGFDTQQLARCFRAAEGYRLKTFIEGKNKVIKTIMPAFSAMSMAALPKTGETLTLSSTAAKPDGL